MEFVSLAGLVGIVISIGLGILAYEACTRTGLRKSTYGVNVASHQNVSASLGENRFGIGSTRVRNDSHAQRSAALSALLVKLSGLIEHFDPLAKSEVDNYRNVLTKAGIHMQPETFRAVKLLSIVVCGGLALLLSRFIPNVSAMLAVVLFAIGGVFGWALPRLYVANSQNTRRQKLEAQLPDAMELLSVALAAGSPVEQSFKVVAANLKEPLSSELLLVDQEVNLLGNARDVALNNLAKRCDSKQVSSFVAQLTQALNLGSSISDGLQRQANLARETQQAAILERIRKMPTKLDVVLSLCFLPPTVLLVTVPTVVKLLDFLSNTMS